MKTVFVLLAVAVSYGFGVAKLKDQMKEMKIAVDEVKGKLPKTDVVYVIELEHRECTPEFFCQVEKVLSGDKGVSQLSNFPDVEKFIRRLEAYNNHTMKNCTITTEGETIGLHQFLDSVKKCIQKSIASISSN